MTLYMQVIINNTYSRAVVYMHIVFLRLHNMERLNAYTGF